MHEFFERAVVKYANRETATPQGALETTVGTSQPEEPTSSAATPGRDPTAMSDVGDATTSPRSSSSPRAHKRKRDDHHHDEHMESPEEQAPPSETPSVKRIKEGDTGEGNSEIPSPPPPPPPPMDTPPTEEDHSMREQEEALMRENEEAQRLEDEAARVEGKQNGLTGMNGSAAPGGGGEEMDVDVGGAVDKPPQVKQQQAVMSH